MIQKRGKDLDRKRPEKSEETQQGRMIKGIIKFYEKKNTLHTKGKIGLQRTDNKK